MPIEQMANRNSPSAEKSETLPWQPEFLTSSLFLGSSALLLAYINPPYTNAEPNLVLAVALPVLGLTPLLYGALRRNLVWYLGGTVLLLSSVIWGVVTQPVQLGRAATDVWPLRLGLVLLVSWAWVFLLKPPRWALRATVALLIPTLILMGCSVAPSLPSALLGTNKPLSSNFPPYWLAVDSRGVVYATDAQGNAIRLFYPNGNPLGTLKIDHLSAQETGGPGIVPAGFHSKLYVPGSGAPPPVKNATPTAGALTAGVGEPPFLFCGLALGLDDLLYIVDSYDASRPAVLQYSSDGRLIRRWPLPATFSPSQRGCVAAQGENVYVSARTGDIYQFDTEGQKKDEWRVDYRPFGMSVAPGGELVVLGSNRLDMIDARTGHVRTTPLIAPGGVPYQSIAVISDGEVLLTDVTLKGLVRVNMTSGEIIGEIGGGGFWPGQFQGLGGVAIDRWARIYVADWQTGAIQRFSRSGQAEAAWWVKSGRPPPPVEVEDER